MYKLPGPENGKSNIIKLLETEEGGTWYLETLGSTFSWEMPHSSVLHQRTPPISPDEGQRKILSCFQQGEEKEPLLKCPEHSAVSGLKGKRLWLKWMTGGGGVSRDTQLQASLACLPRLRGAKSWAALLKDTAQGHRSRNRPTPDHRITEGSPHPATSYQLISRALVQQKTDHS